MKSLFFTIGLFSILLITNQLQAGSNFKHKPSNEVSSIIKQVRELDSHTEIQKLAFRSLTMNQKSLLWQTQIAYCMNSRSLNKSQKDFLSSIIVYFNDSTYSLPKNELSIIENTILQKSIGIFNKSTLEVIIAEVHPDKFYDAFLGENISVPDKTKYIEYSTNTMIDNPAPCQCNAPGVFNCDGIPGYACFEDSKCVKSDHGCGFAWAWACNGMCGQTL